MFKTILASVLLLAAFSASPATITVNPGGSIQAGINIAAAGDTVLVRTGTYSGSTDLNKSVTLLFEPNVTVNGNNSGTAVQINCNSCAVMGPAPGAGQTYEQWWATLPQFLNFSSGIGAFNSPRNDVTIKYIKQRNTNYGFWINGNRWIISVVEVDRIIRRSCGGDADYARVFGDGHLVEWWWFHGTQIPGDLDNPATGGPCTGSNQAAYAHTDLFQHYNQNGEVLKNTVFRYGIGEDFVQGFFLGNETGNGSVMENIQILDVALHGRPLTPAGEILNLPSWLYFIGKAGPVRNAVIEDTTNSHGANIYGIVSGSNARVERNIYVGGGQGTVWQLERHLGTTQGTVVTTRDNIHWQYNNIGLRALTSDDIINVNPNISYTSGSWAGPDNIPFNSDDRYKTTVAAAQGFGADIPTPMFVAPPPVNTEPTITIAPVGPFTLAQGATGVSVVLTAVGGDAETPSNLTYQWTGGPATATWTYVQGVGSLTRTCTVTDAGGLTRQASVTVVVNPAPVVPPPTTDMATQAELDAEATTRAAADATLGAAVISNATAIDTLDQAVEDIKATLIAEIAKVNAAINTEAGTRAGADNLINQRITNLPIMDVEDVVAVINDTIPTEATVKLRK